MALQNGPEVLEELASESRGARRRERRMRRQHRRALRSCSLPPTYPGAANAAVAVGACPASANAPGVPLVPPARGFLHPPPPHLGLRGLSLGLPFPVPTSVSAFGRSVRFRLSISSFFLLREYAIYFVFATRIPYRYVL